MGKETLLSASRRVVRDLNIDLNKGGLVKEATERSLLTLGKQVERATTAQKQAKAIADSGDADAALAFIADFFEFDEVSG